MSHGPSVRTWLIPERRWFTDDQIDSFSLSLVVHTGNPNYWMLRQDDRVQGQSRKLSKTLPQNSKGTEPWLSSRMLA